MSGLNVRKRTKPFATSLLVLNSQLCVTLPALQSCTTNCWKPTHICRGNDQGYGSLWAHPVDTCSLSSLQVLDLVWSWKIIVLTSYIVYMACVTILMYKVPTLILMVPTFGSTEGHFWNNRFWRWWFECNFFLRSNPKAEEATQVWQWIEFIYTTTSIMSLFGFGWPLVLKQFFKSCCPWKIANSSQLVFGIL